MAKVVKCSEEECFIKQSDLIKELRGNLTQQEFAKIVGEHRAHISRYENNKHDISLSKFLSWCEKSGFLISLKKNITT